MPTTKKSGGGRKSTKLPQRVAGVKLSEPVRKRGGKVLAAAGIPLAVGLAAAALTAMGAAAAKSPKVRKAASAAKAKTGAAASEIGRSAANLGTVIAATASKSAKRMGDAYQSLGGGETQAGGAKAKTGGKSRTNGKAKPGGSTKPGGSAKRKPARARAAS